MVNVGWRGTLFSKRKHGKQNIASFDGEYSNQGNWSNQVYWNQRYCLPDSVLGYSASLGWYGSILIQTLLILSCWLIGYCHNGIRILGSRSRVLTSISTLWDLKGGWSLRFKTLTLDEECLLLVDVCLLGLKNENIVFSLLLPWFFHYNL